LWITVDCNDQDATITACAVLSVGDPHPTYGGIIYELDGVGGGKILDLNTVHGLNFGCTCVQHDIPWATSRADGKLNSTLLNDLHPYFGPLMLSQSKGVAWYLPAINDLETIFNVAFKDLGLLNQGVYWSSTLITGMELIP